MPLTPTLKKADQARLLREAGIVEIGELEIGDDAGLIAALSERSLPVWAATADALPERFRQAALAAAVLRQAGCAAVFPLALALNSPRMD